MSEGKKRERERENEQESKRVRKGSRTIYETDMKRYVKKIKGRSDIRACSYLDRQTDRQTDRHADGQRPCAGIEKDRKTCR